MRRSAARWVAPVAAAAAVLVVAAAARAPHAPPSGLVTTAARTAQEVRWLDAGTLPGEDTVHAAMAASALLSLRRLTLPSGAALAGPDPAWRYVWPRDASFTAAALAHTGHVDDAVSVLAWLQQRQGVDGWFEARYEPDGRPVADGRPRQLDGTGWVLWATAAVARAAEDDEARARVLRALAPMVTRSTATLLTVVTAGEGLPPASSDYWERPETRLTLGTAAPVAAGLEAAAELVRLNGEDARGEALDQAAARLRLAVRGAFGPGYPRYPGGSDADAAVAFLMPPFATVERDDVSVAWAATSPALARPAGGLAPGEAWHDDGVSWTPETALFALTAAASGRPEQARRWLDFLDRHRTAGGALPEKVLADGRPAATAPLAWTGAQVLLTLVALDTAPTATSPGTLGQAHAVATREVSPVPSSDSTPASSNPPVTRYRVPAR